MQIAEFLWKYEYFKDDIKFYNLIQIKNIEFLDD